VEGEEPNRAVSDLGGSRANRTSVTSRRSPANGYPPHAGPDDVFGAAAGVERLHLELHNRYLFDSCVPERSRHQADDVAGVFLSAGEKPVELDLDVWVLGAGRVRLFAGVLVGCRYYFGLLLDPLSAEGASTAAGLPFRTALEDFDDCRHLGFLPDKGRTPLGNQHPRPQRLAYLSQDLPVRTRSTRHCNGLHQIFQNSLRMSSDQGLVVNLIGVRTKVRKSPHVPSPHAWRLAGDAVPMTPYRGATFSAIARTGHTWCCAQHP
jgi:hypothetical protein